MSENPKIIAIVDDHPIVVDGLKSLLQSVNKYEVISFFNGKSVIEAFQTQKIDIILLDIVLPDGNGVDFCKEIKTLSPDTIIIGFSNQAEQSTINTMLQNGASGFILKSAPLTMKTAREIMQKQQNRQQSEGKKKVKGPKYHTRRHNIPYMWYCEEERNGVTLHS